MASIKRIIVAAIFSSTASSMSLMQSLPSTGQKPSGNDRAERARGSVPVRRPGLAADRPPQPRDAA